MERVLLIVNGQKLDIRDIEGKTLQADTAFYYPKNDPEALARYGPEGKNGVLEFRKAVVGEPLPEKSKPSSDTMPGKNAPKRLILVNGNAIGDLSPAELDRLIPPDRIVTMDVIRRLDSMPDYAGPVARDVVIIRTKPTEDSSGILTRIIPGLPLPMDALGVVDVPSVPPSKEPRKADHPLVIIDGNHVGRMSKTKLDAILAPDRIARIDLLKGETAIARYGEEG
ncbi:MAG: hypothetical protein EBZ67_04825, partial [Chitinophagia bacterium]|nr:hypothetical protein [Chitinophagia bacterium]